MIESSERCWTVCIWVGMFLGSILGAYVPVWLWDDGSMWSVSGIWFSAIGALIGIAIGFKFSTWLTERL